MYDYNIQKNSLSFPLTDNFILTLYVRSGCILPNTVEHKNISITDSFIKIISADDAVTSKPAVVEQLQNLTIVETTPTAIIPATPSHGVSFLSSDGDSLDTFLQRPCLCRTLNTLSIGSSFDLMTDWLTNPPIVNKLNYFKYFRGTLNVRFLMTASPFIRGRLMVAYRPDGLLGSRTSLTTLSNLPHVILDPSLSCDKTMIIPWHSNRPYLNLLNKQSIGTFIPIIMVPYVDTQTNTGININIRVFVWVTDMELKISTFDSQSKSEYSSNYLMSKPSSVLQSISNVIPSTTPYQLASKAFIAGMAGIASAYGYTRPVQLAPVIMTKTRTMDNISTADGLDMALKLTYDSKSEKTIDTSYILGVSDDQMTLKHVYTRYSYSYIFYVAPSDVLGNVVNSVQCAPTYVLGSTVDFTNVGFVSSMFKFWRGSLIYKFSAVKTIFNRGKLRITWAPSVTVPTTSDTNLAYSVVWDLETQVEIEIEVPFNNNYLWLPVNFKYVDTINGKLTVTVLENITGANITDQVSIQVWVKGGDNMEFAVPTMAIANHMFTSYQPLGAQNPQTGYFGYPSTYPGAIIHNTPIIPYPDYEPQSIPIAPQNNYPHAAIACIGEKISSFREIIKRYQNYKIWSYDLADVFFIPNFPVPPGVYTASSPGYNNANNTYVNYLSNAYVGQTGSMRHKFLQNDTSAGSIVAVRDISRPFTNFDATDLSLPYDSLLEVLLTSEGAAVGNLRLEGALEIETPQTTTLLYNKVIYVSSVLSNQSGVWVASDTQTLTHYTAAADDFNFIWYCGPPTLYFQANVPIYTAPGGLAPEPLALQKILEPLPSARSSQVFKLQPRDTQVLSDLILASNNNPKDKSILSKVSSSLLNLKLYGSTRAKKGTPPISVEQNKIDSTFVLDELKRVYADGRYTALSRNDEQDDTTVKYGVIYPSNQSEEFDESTSQT